MLFFVAETDIVLNLFLNFEQKQAPWSYKIVFVKKVYIVSHFSPAKKFLSNHTNFAFRSQFNNFQNFKVGSKSKSYWFVKIIL